MTFNAFQLDRCQENWAVYCKYRNRARTVIRRAKKKYFAAMFGRLDTSGVWKLLRNADYVNQNHSVFDINVDDINCSFINSDHRPAGQVEFMQDVDSNTLFSFRCVEEAEVFEALHKIHSKSVGVDMIPIRFIKLIYPYVMDIFLHFVNYILVSSTFPLAWKKARVVPIPKSNNVSCPDDLRPIFILPPVSKIVEIIMKNQIVFESNI